MVLVTVRLVGGLFSVLLCSCSDGHLFSFRFCQSGGTLAVLYVLVGWLEVRVESEVCVFASVRLSPSLSLSETSF